MDTNNTTIATVNHIPTTIEDIQVGDIFCSTNPYYGTSVAFYQVVSRTKKFVTVKRMETKETCHEWDPMTGTTVPTTTLEDGEYRHKISERKYDGMVRFDTGLHLYAYPWDGTPREYDWGY